MKSQVQSLIFDKALFSDEEAVEWADKHGYRSEHLDEKKNTWRLEQVEPEHFDKFRTEVLANGVKAIVGTIVKKNPATQADIDDIFIGQMCKIWDPSILDAIPATILQIEDGYYPGKTGTLTVRDERTGKYRTFGFSYDSKQPNGGVWWESTDPDIEGPAFLFDFEKNPIENPAEDINLLQMPDPEEINARIQHAFELEPFEYMPGSSRIPDCTEEIFAFLDYIHLALKALPGILQPDLECEYNFQKGGFNFTFMWLSDEGLSWNGFLGNLGHEGQRPPLGQWEDIDDPYDDEDGNVIRYHRYEDELDRLVWVITDRAQLESRRGRVDEPAYLTHHQVMTHGAHHVDEMVASQQWTYPMNQYGAVSKARFPKDEEYGSRSGRYKGSWQFIGAWHPQWKTEDDFRYWLPDRFGGSYKRRRRRRAGRRQRQR